MEPPHRLRRASWTRPGEAVGLFLRGRTARTAGPTAAVVGTVLSVVNQGTVILDGHVGVATLLRVAVNYAVPYLVASIGWLSARRGPGGEALADAPASPAPAPSRSTTPRSPPAPGHLEDH